MFKIPLFFSLFFFSEEFLLFIIDINVLLYKITYKVINNFQYLLFWKLF